MSFVVGKSAKKQGRAVAFRTAWLHTREVHRQAETAFSHVFESVGAVPVSDGWSVYQGFDTCSPSNDLKQAASFWG